MRLWGSSVALCLCLLGAAPVAPAFGTAEDRSTLPNLVPRPPGLRLGDADPDTGTLAIRLQTPMTNVGEAHLDLLGVPDGASSDRSVASQCIEWLHDRVCGERAAIGYFEWHPEHGHHHFQDFARYELRRLRRGRPDLSPRGLVAGGDKVSFCLMDTNEADSDQPNSTGGVNGWPLYMSCVAGTGQQGISRGFADTYTYDTVGQQIVVDDVRPGTYAVVVTVDPDDRVFESSDADNTVVTKARLTDKRVKAVCVFDPSLRRCSSDSS